MASVYLDIHYKALFLCLLTISIDFYMDFRSIFEWAIFIIKHCNANGKDILKRLVQSIVDQKHNYAMVKQIIVTSRGCVALYEIYALENPIQMIQWGYS